MTQEPRRAPAPAPAHRAQPGTVLIRGLQAKCIIGVRPWERRRRQRVLVDLAFQADFGAAAARDDLHEVVDYKLVKDRVLRHVGASRHLLLESLASSVADVVLEDPHIGAVEVTIDKPGALSHARSVAVRLARQRQEHGDDGGDGLAVPSPRSLASPAGPLEAPVPGSAGPTVPQAMEGTGPWLRERGPADPSRELPLEVRPGPATPPATPSHVLAAGKREP